MMEADQGFFFFLSLIREGIVDYAIYSHLQKMAMLPVFLAYGCNGFFIMGHTIFHLSKKSVRGISTIISIR